MYIKIKLKEKPAKGVTNISIIDFSIDVADLKTATQNTYLNLGTQYAPIRADNFISQGNISKLPFISPNTTITISLEPSNKKETKYNPHLVCCTLKNIGKEFNNAGIEILSNQWNLIFNKDPKHLIPAPNGILYLAPNAKEKCVITTKKEVPDSYLSYSILFSLVFEERSYYFVLDPIIRVNSTAGSGNG
ncbi:hypothetical protein [uncultured Croceitalea sp.]|uniref:hypothetical protein n=1 Tax=uncultured Croceitalea sp. TaxID=1798908 RepID=UPI0033057F81